MSSPPPRPDCSCATSGRRRYPRRVQLASAPLKSPPPSPPRCRHPSSPPPPPPRAALPPPPPAPALRRANPGAHPAHALRCRGHRRIPEPSPTTRLRHPRRPRARGLPGRAHRLFLIRGGGGGGKDVEMVGERLQDVGIWNGSTSSAAGDASAPKPEEVKCLPGRKVKKKFWPPCASRWTLSPIPKPRDLRRERERVYSASMISEQREERNRKRREAYKRKKYDVNNKENDLDGSTHSLQMVVRRILILIALILMHAALALLPCLNSQWVSIFADMIPRGLHEGLPINSFRATPIYLVMVQQEGTEVVYPIMEEETNTSLQIRPRRPRKLLSFPHRCENDLCTDPYNFAGWTARDLRSQGYSIPMGQCRRMLWCLFALIRGF